MDMTQFTIAKSDQMNSDDLMGGPRVITITKVAGTGAPDQPVAIHFEDDNGKPLKPCKTIRRVMVAVWGPDASQYVGRAMRVYRDPKVIFGGMQVGGIRISHMSDMPRAMTIAVNASKGKKAPVVVEPLEREMPAELPPELPAIKRVLRNGAVTTDADLDAWVAGARKAVGALKADGPTALAGWWRDMQPHVGSVRTHHDASAAEHIEGLYTEALDAAAAAKEAGE